MCVCVFCKDRELMFLCIKWLRGYDSVLFFILSLQPKKALVDEGRLYSGQTEKNHKKSDSEKCQSAIVKHRKSSDRKQLNQKITFYPRGPEENPLNTVLADLCKPHLQYTMLQWFGIACMQYVFYNCINLFWSVHLIDMNDLLNDLREFCTNVLLKL